MYWINCVQYIVKTTMSHNIKAYAINHGPLLKRDCISIKNALKNNTSITVPDTAPIYSAYTGNIIAYGSIPNGTICDAPVGFTQRGLAFQIIICDITGTFTAFGIG